MSDGDYRPQRSGRAEGWHVEPDVGFSEPRLRLPVIMDLRDHARKVDTVLDLGCGIGVYGELVRGHMPARCVLYGVDIFAPYLNSFRVRRYYNRVLCTDLMNVVEGKVPVEADCVLCMDVVEHFQRERAERILNWLEGRKLAYMSTPLFFLTQSKLRDNPYEEHLCYFEEKELMDRGWKMIVRVGLSVDGDGGAFRHES